VPICLGVGLVDLDVRCWKLRQPNYRTIRARRGVYKKIGHKDLYKVKFLFPNGANAPF
jgi:hypothetical protein